MGKEELLSLGEIDGCLLRNKADKIEEITDEQFELVLKENRDLMKEFLRNNPQLADKTLEQYTSGLKIFFYWNYENNDNKPFYKISKRDFLRYRADMMERGLSSSGIKFKQSAVSTLSNYCESILVGDDENYKTFRNFCRGLPALPKNKVYDKKPLNKEEYEKLVEYLTNKEDWKKLAYLEFSYSSACRKNEARQLLKEVADYKPIVKEKDGVEIIYYVTHPIACKGSKRNSDKIRPLSFDQRAMDAIKKWLEIRGEDDCPYMFTTVHNKEILQASESAFNTWTKEFARVIGRRIHPHLLRASKATILSEEDHKDIKVIQKLLGHQDSSTTQIYIVRDESNDLEDIYS